jgi:hypothetical protein
MVAETYMQLMSDPAHWLFELTLELLTALVLALPFWPAIKRRVIRKHDSEYHKENKHG